MCFLNNHEQNQRTIARTHNGCWCAGMYFLFDWFFFLKQGFCAALKLVLELALVDQTGLKLAEIHLPLPPE